MRYSIMKALAKLIKGKLKTPNRLWRRPQIEGGGGGVRALAVLGCLLLLASGVLLYDLAGGSAAHAQTLVEITVETVSGAEATYRARDNFATAGTWHYILLDGGADCDADAFSNAGYISSYTEGDDVEVFQAVGSTTICFRSAVSATNVTYTGYGSLTFGDNVGPRVTNVITYRPNARVFNSDNIGDNLTIRVEFGEKVDVDYNGGLGPRLKTNVGTNRYAYIEDGTILRARTVWTFHLTLQAGDNAADLDVLEWDTNGATVEDEAGNPFLPATADSYFPGHLAANHAVTVDTLPPTISVSPVVGNQVSATATDNLDSPVTFFKARPITAAGTCDSSGSPNFSDYTAGTKFRLAVGFRACFHAKDAAGNSAYAVSTAGLAPPTVSVNPSSDDSTRKRTITVSASSSSSGLIASSWRHKNIAGSATCNAAALSSLYSNGAQMTLDNEAYNGNKVCFGVRDNNHNWGYAASGVITNIDRTPPAITVYPSAAHSNTKLGIIVAASSTSSDIDDDGWWHKAIPAATACNAASMSSSTAPGLEVAINSEARNNHKVCFLAKDTAGNRRYRATGVITGIDRTAPAITVSPVLNNQVSATVSDVNDNTPAFRSKIISDNTCDSSVSGFTSYVAGTALSLTDGSRACFMARDFLSNTRYVSSGPGVDTAVPNTQGDTTLPAITVTPSAADSTPKRQIRVFASSSSPDVDSSSWKYKIISASTACDADAVNSGTSSGRVVTLNSQSHNNHKVCFGVKDTSDNWNYAASGIISGIDRTAPSIAVSSVSADNEVDALVSDNTDNSPSLKSQIISDNVCDDNTGGSFEAYTPGTSLSLPIGSRACFEAADSAGNVSYAVSGVGAAPDIGVPANDDTSLPTINVRTVGTNRISATLAGDLSNAPVLEFQIISDNVCDDSTGGSFEAYTAGTSLTLPIGSRACFKVTDSNDNTVYALSAAGKKKKRTIKPQSPPPQSPQEPQQPQLEVNVLTEDTLSLSADDNYDSGSTTMYYRIQSDDACDGAHEGAFSAYEEGTELAPNVSSDYYVCFKSVDNNDEKNVAYSVSALIVVDVEDPERPADDPVDDGETAVDPLPAPSTPDPGSDAGPDPSSSSNDSRTDADSGDTTDPDSSPAPESDSNRGDLLLALVVIGLPSLALVVVLVRRFFWQKN